MKIEKMDTEDKKLLEEMYLEYEVYLRRVAYVNDIPVDYIEDVVQNIFVSYTRYKYSLDTSKESKRALLIRTLKSRCMDFYRRMKYRNYGELGEETYNSGDYPTHDKVANLSDYIVSKERCQALLREIKKMPENWRQVATLRLIEGWPTREVCAMLNITERVCYSRVSHIRKYPEELLKSDNWP